MNTNTKRRAPKGGYDFDAKRAYRSSVWWELSKVGRCSIRNALLMPSIEGTEIENCRKAGFRDHNIYVVDRNPAIVATLRRRNPDLARVPGCHGVDLGLAGSRLADKGVQIHAANFDLTSCINDNLVTTLMDASACLHPDARFAVTILKGREQASDMLGATVKYVAPFVGELQAWMSRFSGFDISLMDTARIACCYSAVNDGVGEFIPIKVSQYASTAGNQYMIWMVFRRREKKKGWKHISRLLMLGELMVLGYAIGSLSGYTLFDTREEEISYWKETTNKYSEVVLEVLEERFRVYKEVHA